MGGAASSGGDLVYTANRSDAPAAYTGDYTTDVAAKLGTYPVTVRFYSEKGAAGAIVAQGLGGATIASDGTGVGTIGVGNTVTSVAVVSGQTVPSGGSVQLAFTARDASGNLVALSEGSAIWSQIAGAATFSLSADGVAIALQAGTGSVQVAVDGVTSGTTPVTVTSAPVASVVVDPGQFTALGTPKQLTLTAKDAQGNTLSIAPESASWTLVDGGSSLALSSTGLATATGVGTAHVQASVGGVSSVSVAISTTSGPVAIVVVDANQTVVRGETKQLTLVAKDSQGNVVVVPSGAAVWKVVDDDADLSLTSGGLATGIGTGTLYVTATVNGIVSAPALVTVTPT